LEGRGIRTREGRGVGRWKTTEERADGFKKTARRRQKEKLDGLQWVLTY
jgi:hypothetical protein